MAAEGLYSLLPGDLAAVPPEVPRALLAGTRVLTTGHESPDADAVGSALGIALALEALGARVETVFADPVPAMYDFMPGVERARTVVSPDLEPDLIVVCDGDVSRTGAVLADNAELFGRVPYNGFAKVDPSHRERGAAIARCTAPSKRIHTMQTGPGIGPGNDPAPGLFRHSVPVVVGGLNPKLYLGISCFTPRELENRRRLLHFHPLDSLRSLQ